MNYGEIGYQERQVVNKHRKTRERSTKSSSSAISTAVSGNYNGTFDEVRLTNSALSTSNFDVPVSAYTAATADVNMRVGNILLL